jgi:prepilin-type N-terminal cleavage/methylation domain-containing protein
MVRNQYPPDCLQGLASPALRKPEAEGFSLLEVLVATAIMGLVLVVLLQVLTSALRAQEASWGHTQAVLTAEKILQENCQVNSLKAGTYQGRDGRYDYVVRITPQDAFPGVFGDKRVLCSLIQVAVAWQEWGRRKTLELQTLRITAQKVS